MMRVVLLLLLLLGSAIGQSSEDDQQVTQLIDAFQSVSPLAEAEARTRLFGSTYVHVTEDGALTTSWRIVKSEQPLVRDRLRIGVFGDVAVATYRWRSENLRFASVSQVFQRQQAGWRIIATQVGGRDEPVQGPIAAAGISPPTNGATALGEMRETWARQILAADLKTPNGDHAEDLDTIRKIFAEDAIYVNPDGSTLSREEVLTRGHPNTVQLSGKQVADAVAANTLFHVDERFAVVGNVVVWTSRNPANRDQSFRVYLKRAQGWQMIFVHHGMSFR